MGQQSRESKERKQKTEGKERKQAYSTGRCMHTNTSFATVLSHKVPSQHLLATDAVNALAILYASEIL